MMGTPRDQTLHCDRWGKRQASGPSARVVFCFVKWLENKAKDLLRCGNHMKLRFVCKHEALWRHSQAHSLTFPPWLRLSTCHSRPRACAGELSRPSRTFTRGLPLKAPSQFCLVFEVLRSGHLGNDFSVPGCPPPCSSRASSDR